MEPTSDPVADPVAVLVAHQPAMRRLARAVVYDEDLAADVAQEASRVALTRPAPAGWAPWAWLAGLVRNTGRNALRSERRRREREREAATLDVATGRGPLDHAARLEEQRRVLGAVLALDAAHRAVLIHRYFDDLSIDEIAARTRVPRETVRTRLRRAIERLRVDLGAATPRARRALGVLLLGAPSGLPPSSPVASVLGALVMKKLAAVLLVLLLVAVGVLAWRVSALADEVDRLQPAPSLLATAAAESRPAPPAAGALEVRPPVLAPADAALASRVAALESRLDRILSGLADAGRTQEDTRILVAELLGDRMRANEIATLGVSRNSISAQAQFQQMAKCDANSNGTGEYGGFLEMSGAIVGRMNAVLNPPVLSSAFRSLSAAGEVTRNGYLFRVYLPDAHGVGVGEPQAGFDRTLVDARLSETTWCVYAWPVTYGKTGTRTFFTNQGGDVLATDAPAYSGSGAGPASDAAFVQHGSIAGRTAIGEKGSDGNPWTQVN